MAEHSDNPLAHVVDHASLELPWIGEFDLPAIGFQLGPKFYGFQITRFMVMEVVAAALIVAIIVPLARHMTRNIITRGRFWNMFELVVMFLRDSVIRPSIDGSGHDDGHDHDHDDHEHHGHVEVGHGGATALGAGHAAVPASTLYMPFLLTLFFFILFNNLIGMVPGGAAATSSINVTGVLALLTLGAVISAGVRQSGFKGYWISLVPQMDVPGLLKPPLWGMMFGIEFLGLLIKHFVLSVRLFANMLAGHIVLAVVLGFIAQASGWVVYLVTPASILGSVALSMLELFVAFLQSYIFLLLASLFIGQAVHPH